MPIVPLRHMTKLYSLKYEYTQIDIDICALVSVVLFH